MTGSLDGRRALVTGSSRNLGASIARRLAREGAQVAICANRSVEDARRLAEDLGAQTGLRHPVLVADLSTPDGAAAVADEAKESLGDPVDILVNNTGPFSITPFLELDVSEWRQTLDANLTAAWIISRDLAPGMRAGGWGRIVNVSAGSAYLRNHATYGLVKHAVITLTESLALELGPEITVNAVAPGQIEESAPDVSEIDPTFVDRAIERTPAGRLVRREEVAEVVLALCTPTFDMLTGEVLALDGGWRFNRF